MSDDPLARLEDEPHMENGVHHPYTAFNQGWDARMAGYPSYRNPYDSGTRTYEWWAMGWTEAGDDFGGYGEIPDPPSMTRRRRRATPDSAVPTEAPETGGEDPESDTVLE